MTSSGAFGRWLDTEGLRRRWSAVRMVPAANPPGAVALSVLILAGAAFPVLFLIGIGHLTTVAVHAHRATQLIPDLLWVGGAFLGQQAVGPAQVALANVMGRDLDLLARSRVLAAVGQPVGIADLEDPEVLDRIKIAQGLSVWSASPYRAVTGFAALVTARLTAIGALVVVGSFRWWLPLLMVAAQLVSLREKHRSMASLVTMITGGAGDLRHADYVQELSLQTDAAKEARVFGWHDWAVDRYVRVWNRAMQPVWRARRRGSVRLNATMLAAAATTLLAAYLMVEAAMSGSLPIGRLVTVLASLGQAASIGFVLGNPEIDLEQGSVAVPAVLELEARLGSTAPRATAARPTQVPEPAMPTDRPRDEIRFAQVGFHYPNHPEPVLDGLDLVIPAGRSTAIVGENGAGKTTIVKLLARLYEPTSGQILVDGADLAEQDPAVWRAGMAAIFQDFVRFPFSAADNVGFGALRRIGDRDALDRAAARSGFAAELARWEAGWDTLLSREFDGGIDLSGGQWQRVALARALFAVEAGAKLLILDEPTAQLDVRAEAEIYDRFLELTRGLTTVVISHRFSTVRRADNILVIEGGRRVEQGSHKELVEGGGRYATMFRLQAARYLEDSDALP